jgi:hypothetical protein
VRFAGEVRGEGHGEIVRFAVIVRFAGRWNSADVALRHNVAEEAKNITDVFLVHIGKL